MAIPVSTAAVLPGAGTREELQEISAYQRSPAFKKQVTLMPALMQYASQELQMTLASLGPELEAKLTSRLTTTP